MDLAIFQTVFNSGLYQEAIKSLSKLIEEKDDLDPLLKSDCYLRLGQWHYESQELNKINEEEYATIIQSCEKATSICPKH